ncbi:MAG: homing endonuclease associated repeat-containing protein [Candidatus Saccharimonadales bacterium]
MLYYFQSRSVTRDGVTTHYPPRTEDEALADLTNFHKTFGRVPANTDFKRAFAHGENYTADEMCRHFGCSWNSLLRKVGLKAIRKPVVVKSDEKMLKDLKKLYRKLGRPLLTADLDDSNMASSDSYCRRFGSFAKACKCADVPCAYSERHN